MGSRVLPIGALLALALAAVLGGATLAQRPNDSASDEPTFHKVTMPLAFPPKLPLDDTAWRREHLSTVQSRVLDFAANDRDEITRVLNALSGCRELQESLVLYYQFPKSQEDALVSFLIASGSCNTIKTAVQDGSIRIVASPEVHYSLIRLIQTWRAGE